MKKFTLVSTVFNEAKRLDESLQELENQTLKPDETIIVDAGSTDGTIEKLQQAALNLHINLKVIVEKGCTVAQGRNIAIKNAENDLIVSTDFGCKYKKDWLESLVKHFDNQDVEVVGGAFMVNEDEITTPAAKADFIIQNGYRINFDDTFSVSSRSIAYYKYVWEKIGGYPEWLTLAADDTIFWRQIKKHGFKYVIDQRPLVYWNRHKTAAQFAKEAGRYGLGDGESGINYRNFLSSLAETLIRYFIIPFTLFFIFIPAPFKKAFAPCFIFLLFGLRSYKNVIKNMLSLQDSKYGWKNLPMCFYMIETQRIAYLKNYFKGMFSKRKEVIEGRNHLDVK